MQRSRACAPSRSACHAPPAHAPQRSAASAHLDGPGVLGGAHAGDEDQGRLRLGLPEEVIAVVDGACERRSRLRGILWHSAAVNAVLPSPVKLRAAAYRSAPTAPGRRSSGHVASSLSLGRTARGCPAPWRGGGGGPGPGRRGSGGAPWQHRRQGVRRANWGLQPACSEYGSSGGREIG